MATCTQSKFVVVDVIQQTCDKTWIIIFRNKDETNFPSFGFQLPYFFHFSYWKFRSNSSLKLPETIVLHYLTTSWFCVSYNCWFQTHSVTSSWRYGYFLIFQILLWCPNWEYFGTLEKGPYLDCQGKKCFRLVLHHLMSFWCS